MAQLGAERDRTATVSFYADSAGVTGQREIRLGLYSFSSEEGSGETIIDENNVDLVLEGNLVFVRPLGDGEESGRTEYYRQQEKLLKILNS